MKKRNFIYVLRSGSLTRRQQEIKKKKQKRATEKEVRTSVFGSDI